MSVFREKSIDRVSSPEELNDYIRVSTPSVLLILLAIILLLIGVIVWTVFGRIAIHDAQGQEKQVAPVTFVTN